MADTFRDLRCPRCGQIDQVRKVSAIVAQGTERQHFAGSSSTMGAIGGQTHGVVVAGGNVALTGMSTTELSNRLAPPAPLPELQKRVWYRMKDPFEILGYVFVFIAIGTRLSGGRTSLQILALILAVVFLLLAWSLKKRWERIGAISYQQELGLRQAAWDEAHTKWDRLFYCGRCDQTFAVSV